MTGEQIEYAFVAMALAVCTLMGYGIIPFGDGSARSVRALKTLRIAGPLGLVCFAVLLVGTFLR